MLSCSLIIIQSNLIRTVGAAMPGLDAYGTGAILSSMTAVDWREEAIKNTAWTHSHRNTTVPIPSILLSSTLLVWRMRNADSNTRNGMMTVGAQALLCYITSMGSGPVECVKQHPHRETYTPSPHLPPAGQKKTGYIRVAHNSRGLIILVYRFTEWCYQWNPCAHANWCLLSIQSRQTSFRQGKADLFAQHIFIQLNEIKSA